MWLSIIGAISCAYHFCLSWPLSMLTWTKLNAHTSIEKGSNSESCCCCVCAFFLFAMKTNPTFIFIIVSFQRIISHKRPTMANGKSKVTHEGIQKKSQQQQQQHKIIISNNTEKALNKCLKWITKHLRSDVRCICYANGNNNNNQNRNNS